MDADNRKSIPFVFGIPIPQLRDDVFTVDSTVGPEFDQNDTTLQIVGVERRAIDPGITGNGRRGSAD